MRAFFAISSAMVLVACGPEDISAPAMPDAKTPDLVDSMPSTPDLPPLPKSLTLEDIDFTAYSPDLAAFTDLAEGQSRIEAIDAVRLYFAPIEGSKIINTSQSTFERDDGTVMLLSASSLADDSIKAQEFYLIFTGQNGDQKLASYGARIKCYRGDNTTDWQTQRCP